MSELTAAAPVVGWPPLRSFRKNLASSSSSQKPVSEAQNVVPNKASSEKPHGNYDKLSSAVDELFRGLLAAQNEPCAGGKWNKEEGEKAITGLLDGSGEYTLVYEDNEGDRMLVGDVPWHMFVSAVKRLRVLKSSELSTLRCEPDFSFCFDVLGSNVDNSLALTSVVFQVGSR
nr:auxin-responsive protein IAA26-like [Ipomoea batatas]